MYGNELESAQSAVAVLWCVEPGQRKSRAMDIDQRRKKRRTGIVLNQKKPKVTISGVKAGKKKAAVKEDGSAEKMEITK